MTGAEPVSDRSLCTVWRGALDSSHSKMKHFLRARLDLARHRFGKMLVDGEPINSQCAMSAGVLEAGVGTLPATGQLLSSFEKLHPGCSRQVLGDGSVRHAPSHPW